MGDFKDEGTSMNSKQSHAQITHHTHLGLTQPSDDGREHTIG